MLNDANGIFESPHFLPLANKENVPSISLSEINAIKDLRKWVADCCVNHLEELNSSLLHNKELNVQYINPLTGNEDIKDLIQLTLKSDYEVIKKMIIRLNSTMKKLKRTDKEGDVDRDVVQMLIQNIDELKSEIVSSKRTPIELQRLKDTLFILEDTNRELMEKLETIEHFNAKLHKKNEALNSTITLKTKALKKAEAIIKELMQEKKNKSDKSIETEMTKVIEITTMTDSIPDTIFTKQLKDANNTITKLKEINSMKDTEMLQLKEELITIQREYTTNIEALRTAASEANRKSKSCMISSISFQPSDTLKQSDTYLEISYIKEDDAVMTSKGVEKKSVEDVKDLLSKVLVNELERYYGEEYNYKFDYGEMVKEVLEKNNEEFKSLFSSFSAFNKMAVEIPKRQQDLYMLLSELFHITEKYNNQAEEMKKIIKEKRELALKLKEDNNNLIKQINELQIAVKSFDELKSANEKLNNDYESYKGIFNTIEKELILLKKTIKGAGIESVLPDKLSTRIKDLIQIEEDYYKLQEEHKACKIKLTQYNNNLNLFETMKGKLEENKRAIENLAKEGEMIKERPDNSIRLKLIESSQTIKSLQYEIDQLTSKVYNLEAHTRQLQTKLNEQTDQTNYFKSISEQRALQNQSLTLQLENERAVNKDHVDEEVIKLRKALKASQETSNQILKELQMKEILVHESKSKVMELERISEAYNNSIAEIKTLKTILMEKSNYIEQLEKYNKELYCSKVQQKCLFNDNESVEIESRAMKLENKVLNYKQILKTRMKEFDLVLNYIRSLFEGIPLSKEVLDPINKLTKSNEELKIWVNNIKRLIEKHISYKERYMQIVNTTNI